MTGEEFADRFLVYSDSFYRVALYILESDADAKDAVQEMYVRLWKARDTLSAVKNPKSYGIVMVRNLCLDKLRSSSYRNTELLRTDMMSEETPYEDISGKERFREVAKAISGLPERERTVLLMKVFDGLTYDEISERTGMSNLTLRVLLSNARRKIRKLKIV